MRFDTAIIGGGLSGLFCGLKLQKAGKKCIMISAGQNAMNFFSGGFGLLSKLPDGTKVDSPLSALAKLPETHPYSKIGAGNVASYAAEAKEILTAAGIKVKGDATRNRYFVSASGTLKPAWLTVDAIASVGDKEEKLGDNILIVNIDGFLDFNTAFIAEAFEKRGSKCRIVSVTTEELARLRKNPTEMRSTNIARVLENRDNREKFLKQLETQLSGEDCILLPAVLGLKDAGIAEEVGKRTGIRTEFIGTMPPSVPGMRIQATLKKAFEAAGGTFLMGDEVTESVIEGNKVTAVKTANFGDITIEADNFVLASGSYFGHGLVADIGKITEPVFDADVEFDTDRNNWYDKDFFARQGFMGFGVKTDAKLRAIRHGETMENLFVTGSELGGCNPLHEGCGSGVAMTSALYVSDTILGK